VVVAVTLAWTVVEFGLVMPVLNRVTGTEQDLSGFDELHGDPGLLLILLALSWTLAAVGEEAAFRGYLLTRATQAGGVVLAVLLTSVLFGLLHTEQGVVGVLLSTLDALLFAGLRLWSGTVWTSVVAHGTGNTVGLVTVFLVGPVHGLW
jgi:membrane protease YdiL (CAAX protease family)